MQKWNEKIGKSLQLRTQVVFTHWRGNAERWSRYKLRSSHRPTSTAACFTAVSSSWGQHSSQKNCGWKRKEVYDNTFLLHCWSTVLRNILNQWLDWGKAIQLRNIAGGNDIRIQWDLVMLFNLALCARIRNIQGDDKSMAVQAGLANAQCLGMKTGWR